MLQSNGLQFISISTFTHDADLKNNVTFGFYIPKNIKIDIRHVPIKQFALYPHFGLPFQPPQEADLKINVRFEFGVPKNI